MICRTRSIRTIFICTMIASCLWIMIFMGRRVDVHSDNVFTVFNVQDKSTQIVKLFQHDLLEHNTERTYYQGGAEISMDKERMKNIVAYGTNNLSIIHHLRHVNFSKCAYRKCQVKYSDVPGMTHESDAIVIQSNEIFNLSPPPRRDKDQVFILAVRDAFPTMMNAIHSKRKAETRKWLGVFNWTMTYRFDSDIFYPYSFLFEHENASFLNDVDYDKIYREKDRDVFWLVSHCRTKSKREDYVKELSSVINVDIYGHCGKSFSCPKHSGGKKNEECTVEVAKRYKFILAFENTFYLDYVTEKVFRWFNLDILTVGRGGTNYSLRFPRETVIDAAEFESATELGHFLKKLGSDKNRYTAYLKRKSKYYSVERRTAVQMSYCNLCEYLHTLGTHRNAYANVAKWWAQGWLNGPRTKIKTIGQLKQFMISNFNNFTGAKMLSFVQS